MEQLVAQYLAEMRAGDASAFDKLIGLVYEDLRGLAGRIAFGDASNMTLHPTALVHEAYSRLAKGGHVAYDDRQHFLRVAAKAMRQILGNYARDQQAQKRGGEKGAFVTLDGLGHTDDAFQLIQLDDALDRLASLDERQARVAELRMLSGMTVEEVAQALDVSERTVKSDWRVAKAWLKRALSSDEASQGD